VLAGRRLYEEQAKVDKAVRQEVIDALLSTIAQSEVAVEVRIAAGEVLGYLGDPRLGEMITIPAGKFLMGSNEHRHAKPQHELFLPTYQIGKYPVTNVEYRQFIESGAYKDKRWWTKSGWEETGRYDLQPIYWEEPPFNKPNQPVVGIDWYECVAYCRWLSAETGQQYRLPTEAEWEKAARGGKGKQYFWSKRRGQRYPWGNNLETNRLNIGEGEQQVRKTTPVGIYPTGVSPFGVFDCLGNVWEWCSTRQSGEYLLPEYKPYPYDVQENEWQPNYLEGIELRVLRGGAWDSTNLKEILHCTFRHSEPPKNKAPNRGFRVVISVAQDSESLKK
jgi:formylglycine-generating enzyme required for sulfatase activity